MRFIIASPLRTSPCGWSSAPVPVSSWRKLPSTNATCGSVPGCAVKEESADRTADRQVLMAPQPEERDISEIVATVQSLRGEAVPDRRELRQLRGVCDPIRLARVLVNAVGERRSEDRAEVSVKGGPVEDGVTEETEILLAVVTDREHVIDAQPPVTRSAVVFHPSAGIGVIRILMSTALEVWRERKCRVRDARGIEVGLPRLPSVGTGQPAEEVVERAVLHHEDDDMLDPGRGGVGQCDE